MVTLNFASGLLNILPGRGLINEVDPAKPFSRHRLSGQIKHQEHWLRRCGLESADGGSMTVIIW